MARPDLIRRGDALDALQIVAAWSDKTQRRALSQAYDNLHRVATVDAVPVVRCKDCKHRNSPYNCPMRKLVMPIEGPGAYEDCTEDDGYCHKGERKEAGTEV